MIIPIIVSSDKTQVILFHKKLAYPIYLMIGNIPKAIHCKPSHHAQFLLGYLPTSHLEHITNHALRHRIIVNLFHACVSCIMEPLQKAGFEGTAMTSGNGITHKCHPIFALFVGDYPEQILATGVKTGQCLGASALKMSLRKVKRSTSIGIWGKYWMHFQHLMIQMHKSHWMCSINCIKASSSISLLG